MNNFFSFLLPLLFSLATSASNNREALSSQNHYLSDTLTETSKAKIALLQNQNELLNTGMNVNNSIFSGLSTYFSVISILLTIIVVILPLVNYFFVLKPSKRAMKKVEKLETELLQKIENNFENYLIKIEHKKAKQLIKALATGPGALPPFVDFFLLRPYSDFDFEDQDIVISFLEKKFEVDTIHRLSLHAVLSSNPSRSCEAYYKKVLETSDKQNYDYAISYLVDNNPENNMAFFELYIINSDQGHKILKDIIRHVEEKFIGDPMRNLKISETRQIGEEKLKLFMNNKKICDSVENKNVDWRSKIIKFLSFPANEFLKETYYYTKYFQKDSWIITRDSEAGFVESLNLFPQTIKGFSRLNAFVFSLAYWYIVEK